jgi:hypothetical protein
MQTSLRRQSGSPSKSIMTASPPTQPAKETAQPEVKIVTLLPLSAPHLTAAVAVLKVAPPGHTPFRLFFPIAVVPSNSANEQDIIATAQPMTEGVRSLLNVSPELNLTSQVGQLREHR